MLQKYNKDVHHDQEGSIFLKYLFIYLTTTSRLYVHMVEKLGRGCRCQARVAAVGDPPTSQVNILKNGVQTRQGSSQN